MPKQERPNGPVQRRWFARGYQEALADIERALADGGESAVREWLTNNLTTRAQGKRG